MPLKVKGVIEWVGHGHCDPLSGYGVRGSLLEYVLGGGGFVRLEIEREVCICASNLKVKAAGWCVSLPDHGIA